MPVVMPAGLHRPAVLLYEHAGLPPVTRAMTPPSCAVDPVAFRPLAEFKVSVTTFARYVKATPPAAGFTEALHPHQLRTGEHHRREGIPIEDETRGTLRGRARTAGLEPLL